MSFTKKNKTFSIIVEKIMKTKERYILQQRYGKEYNVLVKCHLENRYGKLLNRMNKCYQKYIYHIVLLYI